MAPEQLRGKPADARTDVYALGAILFELLTHTSLHEHRGAGRSDAADRILLAEQKANVPPELCALWRKATARDPADRHPSARELADAIESFLSGDRDLASRRALVERHLATAREIRAVQPETEDARSRALAEVGRAIALDPNDGDAMRMLVELLSEPPAKAPPEVLAELERANYKSRLFGLRRAILMYTLPTLFFFLPALVLMGVKSVFCTVLCLGSFLVAGAVAALSHRKNEITDRVPWVTIASSLAMATSAVLCGIYVLFPTFVVGNTICHVVAGRRQQRRMIISIGALALLVPVALELFGLVPSSHSFQGGSLVITSHTFDFREPLAPIFLVLTSLGFLVFTARYLGHFCDVLGRAEIHRLSQLWQLRQLVPERVRKATSEPPPSE
jgi:serine/threonine-protein kinase